MRLGIDASNIRGGGGVTHLAEILRSANPVDHGFTQVVVWSGKTTLARIEDRWWLVKSRQLALEKNLMHRIVWQKRRLSALARNTGCDVLFVPGGTYTGDFRPMVAMSQNLLPFEWRELRRYSLNWMAVRLLLLRSTQSRTFRQAEGIIFLTQYARSSVMKTIKYTAGKTAIIPHGINEAFVHPPRKQLPISVYSSTQPFRILYVSTVDVYKHQGCVSEAVAMLKNSGLHVTLELVGPAYKPALKRLQKTLNRIDPTVAVVKYTGAVPEEQLHGLYMQADLCVFASSCENLPNILLESMASGLPIACSKRGPMPEILGGGGMYFDPENLEDIVRALRELIDSPVLRARCAKASFEAAKAYTWKRCATETFSFLSHIGQDSKR